MGRRKVETTERKNEETAKCLYRKRIQTVWKKPQELAEKCGAQYFFMVRDMKGSIMVEASKEMEFLKKEIEKSSGLKTRKPIFKNSPFKTKETQKEEFLFEKRTREETCLPPRPLNGWSVRPFDCRGLPMVSLGINIQVYVPNIESPKKEPAVKREKRNSVPSSPQRVPEEKKFNDDSFLNMEAFKKEENSVFLSCGTPKEFLESEVRPARTNGSSQFGESKVLLKMEQETESRYCLRSSKSSVANREGSHDVSRAHSFAGNLNSLIEEQDQL